MDQKLVFTHHPETKALAPATHPGFCLDRAGLQMGDNPKLMPCVKGGSDTQRWVFHEE